MIKNELIKQYEQNLTGIGYISSSPYVVKCICKDYIKGNINEEELSYCISYAKTQAPNLWGRLLVKSYFKRTIKALLKK